MSQTETRTFQEHAKRTAQGERDIQAEIDRGEARSFASETEPRKAMQARARPYPEPPFPEQRLRGGMNRDARPTADSPGTKP